MTAFGAWLRAHREAANLSQKDLAELAQISPAYLNDIERGRRNPPSEAIVSTLCEWLHVSVAVGQFYAGHPAVDLDTVRATDAEIEAALGAFRQALWYAPSVLAGVGGR